MGLKALRSRARAQGCAIGLERKKCDDDSTRELRPETMDQKLDFSEPFIQYELASNHRPKVGQPRSPSGAPQTSSTLGLKLDAPD